jgi:hypothetical protein
VIHGNSNLTLIKTRASIFIEPKAPLRLYKPVIPLILYTHEHLKVPLSSPSAASLHSHLALHAQYRREQTFGTFARWRSYFGERLHATARSWTTTWWPSSSCCYVYIPVAKRLLRLLLGGRSCVPQVNIKIAPTTSRRPSALQWISSATSNSSHNIQSWERRTRCLPHWSRFRVHSKPTLVYFLVRVI